MKPREYALQQVSYHDVLLTPTVVRVEVDVLAKPMYFHEVVEHTTALPISCFIHEVVDLMWNGFTAYPKMAHFWGVRKYMGPGWRGSFGLGHVKGVCCDITTTQCCLLCRWQRAEITGILKN